MQFTEDCMEEYDYHITDNFDARHLYSNAIFLAKMVNYRGIEFIGGGADKDFHSYEEAEFEINGNKVNLHLITPHVGGKRVFAGETLMIKFEGNKRTKILSKRGLEAITGITISSKFRI